MEIRGHLIHKLAESSFKGKNGDVLKREFVIQPPGPDDKPVAFTAYGDKTDILKGLLKGEELIVAYKPESRSHNEKWYTELKVSRIDVVATGASTGSAGQSTSRRPPQTRHTSPAYQDEYREDDDLPW